MKNPVSSRIRLIFLLGDILILNLAVVLAIFACSLIYPASERLSTEFYLCINLAWISLAIISNPYKFSRVSRFAKILSNHFVFILIHFLVITSILFFTGISNLSNIQLLFTYGILIVLLFFWRIFFFYLNKILINKNFNYKNVVIVGFGELAWDIRKFFRLHPEYGYRFMGYFDKDNAANNEVTDLDQLESFCVANNIHEIYCCLPYLETSNVRKLVDFGLNNLIKIKLITDYRGFFLRGLKLENYDHIPVLNVAAVPLDDKINQFIKRAFDVIFSSLVIIFFLSWAIPLISLAIKLDSRGPVFFRQKRSGKGNMPFNCLKFRTMVVHNTEFKQATKNDPRITKIGKFLRKTSLDELPQFINVLLGEMSIIGPRPHPIKLNEEFSPKIEKFMARHYIKPGITGLAQAKGYRGETINYLSMKSRVKLDRFYIENWSFFLDLQIVVQTIVSIAKGDEKAY